MENGGPTMENGEAAASILAICSGGAAMDNGEAVAAAVVLGMENGGAAMKNEVPAAAERWRMKECVAAA